MLVNARKQTYTKDNIMSAWRGSGLIPLNLRTVLITLPTYHENLKSATSATSSQIPRNSKALLHKARQAKLLLKATASLVELFDLIESLERLC